MWLKSIEARERFDKELTKAFGSKSEEIEECRLRLAAFPSATLVKYWFGETMPAEVSPLEKHLREKLRTRAALFSWIHGPGASIARDLLYVKLPSSEKRRFVNLLLASLRLRMPWMESRLIHAMAFRPAELNRAAEKTVGETKEFKPWGPLYRGVKIGKRKGYRQLWLPNPPLKATQGALLRLIAPGLTRALQPFVFGASAGCSGPTFENAAAHLGKAYVATFDLREFFPSTSVGDVIRGLRWAANRGHSLIDAARVPSYLKDNPQVRSLQWTDDAIVLVARLATYRARLPQGSPLSPLLANIAFARFDEKILDALKHEFGKGQFAYTRYFDDLTISVSGKAVRKHKFELAPVVGDAIEKMLEAVLDGSSYALNGAKSRCTKLVNASGSAATEAKDHRGGHHVTGLVLRSDSVELARDMKRELRATIHRLKHRDFVEDARVWHQSKNFLPPAFQSLSKGHRWKRNTIMMRRCSAERLSALMLRQFHPDLRVKALLRGWYPWQERFIGGEPVRRGKHAWPLVEWLLAALWTGTVAARRQSDNSIRFSQDGVDVCDIEAESALHFFRLTKESAIAVTEYWHHLRGLKGFLHACPNRSEFSDVIKWRSGLDEAMSVLEIKAPEAAVETVEVSSAEPLTIDGHVKKKSDRLIKEYREFARRISVPDDSSSGKFEDAVRNVATSADDFDRWISGIRGLFITRLPKLPAVVERKGVFDHRRLFEALRVWDDATKKLVADDYTCVEELRIKLKIAQAVSEDKSQFARAQERILDWLLAFLDQSTEHRRDGTSGAQASDWRQILPENPWHGTLSDRLDAAINELVQEHKLLQSSSTETKLFSVGSGSELAVERETLRSVDRRNNDEAWKHLLHVAKVLFKVSQESVETSLWIDPVDATEILAAQNSEKKKQMWKKVRERVSGEVSDRAGLVQKMRNRDAHPATDDARADWCAIQVGVAGILGRSWKSISGRSHARYHAPDDLELFGHEAVVMKLELIRSLSELFRKAREKQVWKQ